VSLKVPLFVARTSDVPRMPANYPIQEGKDNQAVPKISCGPPNMQHLTLPSLKLRRIPTDQIAASIYDKYSVGISFEPICSRCCFTVTHMIQVCSDFQQAQASIIHARPDQIGLGGQYRIFLRSTAAAAAGESFRTCEAVPRRVRIHGS